MDRSRTLTATVVAAFVSCAMGLAAQDGVSVPPLDALIERAASIAPGTYQLRGGSIDPATPPLPMLVQADVLRAADRTVRVPISLGSRLPQSGTVRLRVIAASAPSRVIADVNEPAGAGPLHLIREFPLAAGSYEIQAAVAYGPGGAQTAALAKTSLTVPDPWGTTLAVTPVVLGETVGLAPQEARSRPFNFGPTALTPATAAAFAQSDMLHVAYRIYNWRAEADEAPDLTAEYVFHEEAARRPLFFNKAKAQRLNAQTLGKAFDPRGGAVAAGLSVSLTPFPPGEYRLTVRVHDNRGGASAEQRVRFSVHR
jgi:hypothetical protein